MSHTGIKPHREYADGQDVRLDDRVKQGRRRGTVIDFDADDVVVFWEGSPFGDNGHEVWEASGLTLVERDA